MTMKLRIVPLIACAIAFSAQTYGQGLLNPPSTGGQAVGIAGPLDGSGGPMPTMKTLHQVEPRHDLLNGPWGAATKIVEISDSRANYVIKEPGSYYLSNNLDVVKSCGIIIEADNVTLDLNGFVIHGQNAGTGIKLVSTSGAPVSHFRILNGTLSKLAVGLGGLGNGVAERLQIRECSTNAVLLSGSGAQVSLADCQIVDCQVGVQPVVGISGYAQASLTRVAVSSSSGRWAVQASPGNLTMIDCRVTGGDFSEQALNGGNYSRFEGCEVRSTGCYAGFVASYSHFSRCQVAECALPTAPEESSWGLTAAFFLGADCNVTHCQSVNNNFGWGFLTLSGAFIHGCTASNSNLTNTQNEEWGGFNLGASIATDCMAVGFQKGDNPNQGVGFRATIAVSLRNCSAIEIEGPGFKVLGASAPQAQGSSLHGCTAYDVAQGILVESPARADIRHCHFSKVTGAGMAIEGDNSTIDSNVLSDCVRAFNVTGTANVITRNQLSRSSLAHWNVASGNRVGKVIRPAVTSIMISGDGVGDGFASTDPWANFVD